MSRFEKHLLTGGLRHADIIHRVSEVIHL